MPGCGKTAFVNAASRLNTDWVDSDAVITMFYTWDLWWKGEGLEASASMILKLIQNAANCGIITNLDTCTPQVTFGRKPEVAIPILKSRMERSGNSSKVVNEKVKETEREYPSWFGGWMQYIEKWKCPAFLLEEDEYIAQCFGLSVKDEPVKNSDNSYVILKRVLLSIDDCFKSLAWH